MRPALAAACALMASVGLAPLSKASAFESSPADEAKLLVLRNDKVVVGILPRIGGRVVLLRSPGGKNVFLSDPSLWDDPDVPIASPNSDYKFYGGHTTWLGPQFHWWSQQELNPARVGQEWPPDPYLEFTNFKIVSQSSDRVSLLGPEDPVSGIRMSKDIQIDTDGIVHVAATITNFRKTPVSWEIWSDTRLPGRSPFYIPVQADQWFRTQFGSGNPTHARPLPYEFRDGFFSFRNDKPFPKGIYTMVSKAFLRPSEGVEAAFVGDSIFLKRSPLLPPNRIEPEQAFAEAYVDLERSGKGDVLELEMQSEYQTLGPGDSLSFAETWQVLPYRGGRSRSDQIAYLKKAGIAGAPNR